MNKLAIRLCGGTILGALFGILCFYGLSKSPNLPENIGDLAKWSTSNFLMWEIIVNRAVLGFTIGLAGFMTIHPLFGFKLPVALRGFFIGVLATLTMSFGILIGEVNDTNAISAFWITTLAGGIIGLVIDIILTKIAGQGTDLLVTK